MTSENNKIYLYPLWLRIWHGINALGIILLIITGIRLQYSDLRLLSMDFGTAVQMHNISGVVVTLNYFVFIIGNLVTPNKKYYRIKPKGLVKRVRKQANYYLSGLFKGEEAPFPISEKKIQSTAKVCIHFCDVRLCAFSHLNRDRSIVSRVDY